MAHEKAILKDTVSLSIFKYLSFILTLISTAVLLRLLPTATFGIYSAILLALNYSRFAFLVPYSAAYKKIPFLRGQGRSEKAVQAVRDLSFGPTFFVMAVIAVAAFFISFFLPFYSSEILNSIRLLAVLVLLQHFFFFYTNFLRIDKKFSLVGFLELVLIVIRLLLFLLLVKPLGLEGALIAFIISFIATSIFGFFLKRYSFSFSPKTINRTAWRLFVYGLPPAIVGIISTLFVTVDRVMIINFLNSEMLGYYAFAAIFVDVIIFVPDAISTVIFPRQTELFGRHTSAEKIKNFLIFPVQIISCFVPFVIAGAFFFVEFFVRWLFPNYIPAIPTVNVLILSAFFLAIDQHVVNFLISLSKEKVVLFVRVLLLLLAVVLSYFFISAGFGILGVACSTIIIFFVEFVFLSIYSLALTGLKKSELLKIVLSYIVPFILMLAVFYLSKLFAFDIGFSISSFLLLLLEYLIFCLLNLPLLYYLNKKTGVITLFYRELFKRKIRNNT
jgi:O-antigen/teichoic acid export membrane protein